MTISNPSRPPCSPWRSLLSFLRNILAVFGGLVVLLFILSTTGILPHLGETPKSERAMKDLCAIRTALKLYYEQQGHFPSTQEGIPALVVTRHLDRIPTDPWGREYDYLLDDKGPHVTATGADGAPGGEDVDADIDMDPLEAEPISRTPASVTPAASGARDAAPLPHEAPASHPLH
ncbi:type II secretion system protein GspG [Myxococcaceae bacterium JPH2]|nr:type II secretion system protein GspG [Myxococcaceae bacterium JPH2]